MFQTHDQTQTRPSSVSLRSLSLATKIGQLFVAGFDGNTPTAEIESLIAERHLGGIIYFDRNIESPSQLRRLSRTLQNCVREGPPLFVAIDQEGGRVARLPWETALPSAMSLGGANDASLAMAAGEATGRELRRLGINCNLTPVLDVYCPTNPVIGVRSFGDCESAAELGPAFAEGLRAANIVACGKHFPGHGATTVDSHFGLPRIDHARDRLSPAMHPFRAAIDAGIDMVMTAHVAYPALGTGEQPATVSQSVVTDLLRDELGFEGLVITDCMEMDAIADTVGAVDGAVQAIEAGCDLITVSHSPDLQHAAIDAVTDAVETGRLSEERIDASVRRITRVKRAYNAGTVGCADWLGAARNCRAVARTVAERSITLVRNEGLPLPTDRTVTVYEFEHDRDSDSPVETERKATASEHGPLASALSTQGVDVNASVLTRPPKLDARWPTVVRTSDTNDPVQEAVLRRLSTDTNSDELPIVVTSNPHDFAAFPACTVVLTYDDTQASFVAAAEVLIGERTPTGQLPITIPTTENE